jgi:hypothetical protein
MGHDKQNAPKGEARLKRIEEMRTAKMTYKAIAQELGISYDRVRQLVSHDAYLKCIRIETPNAAAISTRGRNALDNLLYQAGENRSAFDRDLPQRASKLTRRDLKDHPNIGVVTIAEIEQWLKSHGLKLSARA